MKKLDFLSFQKTLFTLFIVLGCCLGQLKATHLLGGELTYACVGGGNTFEVTAHLYFDCAGIAPPQVATIMANAPSCLQNLTFNLPQVANTELPTSCPNQPTTCNGGQFPGVRMVTYRGFITLPIPCSDWHIYYNDCCRSGAVNNLNNPGGSGFYLEATLNAQQFNCNSSPVFNATPIVAACVNTPLQFDLSANDPDGDSLVYSLVNPMENVPPTAISFVAPYTLANPFNSPGGVTISPQGIMSFTVPNTLNAVYAVRVDEYRNGSLVGSITRDITLIGVTCQNNNPNNPVFGAPIVTGGTLNGNVITAAAGAVLNMTFSASDADPGQIVTLANNIAQALPGAVVTTSGVNPALIFVGWTVNPNFFGATFTINALDNICPIPGNATATYVIGQGCSVVATGQGVANCDGTPSQVNLAATVVGPNAGGGTWSWTPANLCATPNAPNTVATITGATTFIVSYDDGAGCAASATVVIPTGQIGVALSYAPQGFCPGTPTTVTLVATPSVQGGTWSWSPNNLFPNQNQPTQTAVISQGTLFEVTYTLGGCTATETAFIGDTSGLNFTVSPDLTICGGQSTQLEATLAMPGGGANCSQYGVSSVTYAPLQGNGTAVALGDDQLSGSLPIGFTFPFFCNNYTSFHISSNGFITFDPGAGNGCCDGQALPNPNAPNNLVALCWEDINPAAGGTIDYFTTGVAPNRRLVVNYNQLPYYGQNNTITGQIVLHEGTGIIDIFSTQIMNGNGIQTQGVENANGTLGFTVNGRNGTSWTASNDGYRFMPGAANVTYLWVPATGLNNANIYNPIASPTQTTQYVVFANNGNCTFVDTVNVMVDQNGPQLTSIPDQSICAGQTITLNATGNNLGNAQIGWISNNQQFYGNGPVLNITPYTTTTFYLTAQGGCGFDVDTFTIFVGQPPFIVPMQDVVSPGPGAAVTLYTPAGPNTLVWTTGGQYVDTGNPIIVNPTVTTTYDVTYTNNCGTVTESVTVYVTDAPVILNINANPDCIQAGMPVVISGQVGNMNGTTYELYEGQALILTQPNPMFTVAPNVTTTYMMVATNNFGADTAYVTVSVNAAPVLDPLPNPIYACGGQPVTLTATGQNLQNADFTWYLNGPAQYTQTVTFNPLPTANTIMVIASNGCGSDTSVTIVFAYPLYTSIALIAPGELQANANGGTQPYTYLWNTNETTQTITGANAGIFVVTITDAAGCTGVASYMVSQPTYSFVVNTVDATCGNADGSATVTITAGFQQPIIQWSNGQTGPDALGLAAGGYSVTVTDGVTGYAMNEVFYVNEDQSCYVTISGYVYDDDIDQACLVGGNVAALGSQLVRLSPSNDYVLTDGTGYYEFIVPPGNYTVTLLQGNAYDILCPVGGDIAVAAPVAGGVHANNNYFLIHNIIQDLCVNAVHGLARQGNSVNFTITYCNYGSQPMSGTVTFTHDALLQSFAASPAPASYNAITHTATWNFVNLLPGQCATITAYAMVPVNAPIGTTLFNEVSINPINGDDFPNNNHFQWTQQVVAAWDPNYKEVTPTALMPGIDSLLTYTIHFQNTGNFPAQVVIVRDTLDVDLDAATVHLAATSHNCVLTIEDGNILVFTFNNINLPDSTTDFAGSQGWLQFTIETVPNLAANAVVQNRAAIYFDFNEPIITNTVSTSMITGAHEPQRTPVLGVAPNPFGDVTTLTYEVLRNGAVTIELMDISGRRLRTLMNTGQHNAGVYQMQLPRQELASGAYFIRMVTSDGAAVTKVVVE